MSDDGLWLYLWVVYIVSGASVALATIPQLWGGLRQDFKARAGGSQARKINWSDMIGGLFLVACPIVNTIAALLLLKVVADLPVVPLSPPKDSDPW